MSGAFEVETLAHWIEKSLCDTNGRPVPLDQAVTGLSYLEGAHQTTLLFGKLDDWDAVAAILVSHGVLDGTGKHRRYVKEVV